MRARATFTPKQLDRDAPFYVAGHRGLVGSAIWRHLQQQGFTNLIGKSSGELDLRDRQATFSFFEEAAPNYVVVAAARVGGILANATYPVDFLSENLRIQTNVLDAARAVGVQRLLFLGSSCIYPRITSQPIPEDALLSGHLEPTNDGYAIAKIAGILHVQAVRRQYGMQWISAMPTNLYGPHDNFSGRNSHVLPAFICRYDDAVQNGQTTVTNWGSGRPRREFLHSDDMADACLYLLENYDGDEHVNIGTGIDQTIDEIAAMVAREVGFDGTTSWDTTKPDGTPQKLLDTSKLRSLGWAPQKRLKDGIAETVRWYREHRDSIRL